MLCTFPMAELSTLRVIGVDKGYVYVPKWTFTEVHPAGTNLIGVIHQMLLLSCNSMSPTELLAISVNSLIVLLKIPSIL